MSEIEQSPEILYTPLSEAIQELNRRRRIPDLCRLVESFQSEHPANFLLDKPTAILARSIHSADHEMVRFESMIRGTELTPHLLEIPGDLFTSVNHDKYRRGKLCFDFETKVRSLRVMEFNCEGKIISTIPDVTGRSLVDYHRALLNDRHPALSMHTQDVSDWFLSAGKISPYYLHFLSLSIKNGIVFENFLPHEPEEMAFFRERVLPSFLEATRIFGVRPLIVRLFSDAEETTDKIWHYPGSLYPLALKLTRRGNLKCNTSRKFPASVKVQTGLISGSMTWQHPKTSIRNTERYGRGVFANKRIKNGEILFVIQGPLLNRLEEMALPAEVIDKPIEISPWLSISPRSIEELEAMPQHFVNHSCQPNAGFGGQMFLVAMRDIGRGEEVTFDYGMCLRSNSETEFRMECLCGAENCRKVVMGGDWQIPELQVRYAGYFQWYLERRILNKSRSISNA